MDLVHSLHNDMKPGSSTYREKAQDRIAGRLQGTNGTSHRGLLDQSVSTARPLPMRLYSGTGGIGLGGRPR